MTDVAAAEESDGPTRHEESGPPSLDVAAEQPLRIGRYAVLGRLGAGGMGVVYKAYDADLDRRVALKVLHIDRNGGSLGGARMVREAQALAKLSHPNVVHVYEVDRIGDRVYVVMEYLSGLTLRAWLKSKARTWREILDVYLQAGRGLAAAHAAGLVHRDFKPDNAIVGDDGRVRVLDFGLARGVEGEAEPAVDAQPSWSLLGRAPAPIVETQGLSGPLTEAGTLLGTPAYMSPEQLLRRPADARSDQFSFCVSLWEALFGSRPFAGRTLEELGPQVFAGPPRLPRGGAPTAVGRELRRGLSMQPGDRHADMPALLAALTAAGQRGRRIAAVAAAAVVLVGASVGGYVLAGSAPSGGRCDAAAALGGVWDAGSREEARRAVLATGAAFADDAWAAAERQIDAYAHDLQVMLQRSCLLRQSGALAAEVQALHEACLERRRGELGAVVGVLKRADVAAARGAAQAVFGLSPPARCGDLAALRAEAAQVTPPTDAAQAEAVAGLRDRLAAVKAEQDAGRFAAAREAAVAVVAEAERVAYEPTLAEALHRLGLAQSSAGEYEGARDSLHRAFALAEQARHDAAAAGIAVILVHLHGVRLHEPGPALTWQVVADAKLRRTGGDAAQRVALLNNAGMALVGAERLAEGAELQRRALELARARGDEGPLDRARVLNSLASTLTDLGRLDEAEPLLREALELRRRHLGPRHPDVAVVLHNLGKVQYLRRDIEGALVMLRMALEIRERSLGPQHPGFGETLNALAVMLCASRRHSECLAMMRRSVELVEAARGPEDPSLITPLINLGNVLIEQHDLAGAGPPLDRAMAIVRARGEDDGLDAALILYNYGQLELDRGEPRAAIERFRRVLTLRRAILGPGHFEVGTAASRLAEALLRAGEHAEASVVAREASEVLGALPEAAPEWAQTQITAAELLWPREPAAARALVEAASAKLDPVSMDHETVLAELAKWLRAHPDRGRSGAPAQGGPKGQE